MAASALSAAFASSSSSSRYSWGSITRSSQSKPIIQTLLEGRLCVINQNCNFSGSTSSECTTFVLQKKGKFTRYVHKTLTTNAKSPGQLKVLATSVDEFPTSEQDTDDPWEEKVPLTLHEESKNDNGRLSTGGGEGKPGFISFHELPYQRKEEVVEPMLIKEPSNLFWFISPTILVASFVFPSIYMRKIVLLIFEDSLLTDFLILFFTEALFYSGVAAFVLLVDKVWKPLQLKTPTCRYFPKAQFELRISSVTTLVLNLIIPFVTMGVVWPWTGPAASATLAPYVVGIVMQFAFEQYALRRRSTAWPVIPIVFQVYRLHQLNRAAQLVTALSLSVRGAENTAQTFAINNSLGILFNVLQLLGVICIWTLSSFLMRFIPSSPVIPDT